MTEKRQQPCKHHGDTTFFAAKASNVKGGIRWRCQECSRELGRKHRRSVKEQLVEDFGGKCVRCGYDKCLWALHFHHRDRENKEFSVSTRALPVARLEAAKCDLLCANCHYEVETETRAHYA